MSSSRNSTLTFSQNTFNSELINEYKIIRDSYLQIKNRIYKVFKYNNYLDDLFNIFDSLILFFNQISQTFRTIQEGNEFREQILKNIVKINLEMNENLIINFLNKISLKINSNANKNHIYNNNNNNLSKKNIINLKNYFHGIKTTSNSNLIKKDSYKYNNNYKINNTKNKNNINITETNINKRKSNQKFVHKSASAININENNNNNNNLNNNKNNKSINKSISTEINTSIPKENKKKLNISKNNNSPFLSKKKMFIKNKISNNIENNKKEIKNKKSKDELDFSFLSKKQLKRKELKSFDAANSKNFNYSFKDLNNSSFLPSERKRLDTYSGVNRQTAASASKKKIYKKHMNNFEENLVSKFHGILDKYNNTNTEQDYIKNTKEYLKNIIEMQKKNN